MRYSFILIALFILSGCADQSDTDQPAETLFALRDKSQTNLDFKNEVTDTKENNFLIYESFYNGGGVALGDINNDGLPDLYFSGNQMHDKLYLNKGNLKFLEITDKSGILKKGGWSTGVTMADVNNDGWLDIYVCKSLYDDQPGLRENELYINNKDLTFTESADKYGLNDNNRSMDASFFDYDQDGDQDLLLVNQPPNPGILSKLHGKAWLDTAYSCRLYRNDLTTFVDVSGQSGIQQRGYGLSASTADFNNDGWTDIFVANDYDSPDQLFINQGDGTFLNMVNQSMRHISYFSMGTDVGDIDNDGWTDLVVVDMVAEDNFGVKSNMSGMQPEQFWNIVNAGGNYQYMYNTLHLNSGINSHGQAEFSEIGQQAGISSTGWSWSPLLADFDNDGLKDLFVSNGIRREIRNTDALKKTDKLVQQRAMEYIKKTGSRTRPLLNDLIDLESVVDYIPVNKIPNYIYRNNGNYGFEKLTGEWGINHQSFSSGAAYGDLDNDGDLDLVVSNLNDFAFLYENQSSKISKNNYLRVKLVEGDLMNKSFFGAKVEIVVNGIRKHSEVVNARGFYSSSEPVVHFGLGESEEVEKVTVYWPDGAVSTVENIKANQELVLDKGEALNTGMRTHQNYHERAKVFVDFSKEAGIRYKHVENVFDDYAAQVLLPHKMSQFGPALATGDVNGDGLEDFFIGAAAGRAGQIYLQKQNGSFENSYTLPWFADIRSEDVGAVFFDCDGDDDLDLFVVSGSNEYPVGSEHYLDRLYVNDGRGGFSKAEAALPKIPQSGSRVIPGDYDNDGDLDLFVAGRQVPGQYPRPASSYLLKNETISVDTPIFTDATAMVAPELEDIGMVTDAVWMDYDQDNDLDLIISGVWMPVTIFENGQGKFRIKTSDTGLEEAVGWWFSLEKADIDNDGDDDLLAGNLGLNYKYKATSEEPFTVHYDDFDNNGKNDIVLGYFNFGEHFPLRGRSCSSEQVPSIKEKFTSYNKFASATLSEVYGAKLNQALQYSAKTFASKYIENLGSGKFKMHDLPARAQFAPINDVVATDVDGDGHLDIIAGGNLFISEIETIRADAGTGVFLKGNGKGNFVAVSPSESGLYLTSDIRHLGLIKIGNNDAIIAAANNDFVQVYTIKK